MADLAILESHRPVWAEVDLDCVKNSVQEVKKLGKRVVAVVKADGYGHGAAPVARAALQAGASALAVAIVEEGVHLRKSGFVPEDTPILVMGLSAEGTEECIIMHSLTPTISSIESAQRFGRVAKHLNRLCRFHLKIDTGMGRVGLLGKEVTAFVDEMKRAGCGGGNDAWISVNHDSLSGTNTTYGQHLYLEAMYTHFSKADEVDKEYTARQVSKFIDVLREVQSRLGIEPICHIQNSAGTIDEHRIAETFSCNDMEHHISPYIRLGISLYGFYPSNEVDKSRVQLRPALTWKAKIAHVKQVDTGSRISYGGLFIASKPSIIATIPLGYADGFRRMLGHTKEGGPSWHVLIGGNKSPIAGRVCMDMFMVDVTGTAPDCKAGDEVVLIGKQRDEIITADEMAAYLSTINYEITCLITKRVPRIYLENGKTVGERESDMTYRFPVAS